MSEFEPQKLFSKIKKIMTSFLPVSVLVSNKSVSTTALFTSRFAILLCFSTAWMNN